MANLSLAMVTGVTNSMGAARRGQGAGRGQGMGLPCLQPWQRGGRRLGCAGVLHPGLCSAPQGASPILVPTRGPRPPTPAGCCPHRCWHPTRLQAQGQSWHRGRWQCPAGTALRVPELVAGSQAGSAMQAGCGPSGPAMQAASRQRAATSGQPCWVLGQGCRHSWGWRDHSWGRDPPLSPAHPTASPAL